MPAYVRECLLNVGAELVYLGLVLGSEEHSRQQCRQRRGNYSHYGRKDCFSHQTVSLFNPVSLSQSLTSKLGQALIHSAGSTVPFPLRSGE